MCSEKACPDITVFRHEAFGKACLSNLPTLSSLDPHNALGPCGTASTTVSAKLGLTVKPCGLWWAQISVNQGHKYETRAHPFNKDRPHPKRGGENGWRPRGDTDILPVITTGRSQQTSRRNPVML